MTAELPIPSAEQVLTFVLILTRIGAAITIAPLFSSRALPIRVRVIVAVTLTFILLSFTGIPREFADLTLPMIFTVMLKEALVGLAIGLAAGVALVAFQVAGSLLDLMTGFSYGGVIDPQYGNQSSIMQQLYVLLAGMIFVVTDGLAWFMTALVRSFERLPLEGMPAHADFAQLALTAITTVFVSGIGVIAPVMIALLLTDVAFGLVSRAAPQTQIIQVEFPVKIAVGIVMMVASLPLLVPVFQSATDKMLGLAVGGG